MPTYVYKGGKKIAVMGIVLLNAGDEIELDSLKNVTNPNRLMLKEEWIRMGGKIKSKTEEKAVEIEIKQPVSVPVITPAKKSVVEKIPEEIEKANIKKTGGMTNG